jgi:hypothetical protein
MADIRAASAPPGRLTELRGSARGWHGIQLAVLGFIGLCGVLQPDQRGAPSWLQALAGILALAALVLACVATYLIGRVAWPLYGWSGNAPAADEGRELAVAGRRLTVGLVLTFAAVALTALAASISWWPRDSATTAAQVQAQSADGQAWCGQLAATRPGALGIDTARGPVVVALASLSSVRPVDGC